MPESRAVAVVEPPPARRGWRERCVGLWREGLRSRLLRNIATVITGTAGAQAVTMAFMPVITRLYGPEAYGILGTFLSLSMTLVPVAALTYPIAIVLQRRDSEARALVRLSILLALGVAVLMSLVLLGFGERIAHALGIGVVAPYLLLLPWVMFCGALLEISQQWLFRQQRFRLTASMAALHSLLFNSLRSIAGLLNPSALVLVTTSALNQALHAALLGLGMFRRHADAPRAAPETAPSMVQMARRHRDFPLFRAPQVLINGFSQHLPTLVLAAFFGPVVAGFFALCKQALGMPTNLVGKSVGDVYYPRLSAAIHAREPVTGLLLKGVGGLALVGLVPFSLVFCFGPPLFAWIFGPQWRVAGEFASYLALAEYTIFLSRPCVVAVPALSLQGQFLIFEVVSTSLRILALLSGAVLLGEALITVQAFAAASIAIYLSLVAWVLVASARWYRRLGGDER